MKLEKKKLDGLNLEDIQKFSRKDLQEYAKSYNIPANKKSDVIREQLVELLSDLNRGSVNDDSEAPSEKNKENFVNTEKGNFKDKCTKISVLSDVSNMPLDSEIDQTKEKETPTKAGKVMEKNDRTEIETEETLVSRMLSLSIHDEDVDLPKDDVSATIDAKGNNETEDRTQSSSIKVDYPSVEENTVEGIELGIVSKIVTPASFVDTTSAAVSNVNIAEPYNTVNQLDIEIADNMLPEKDAISLLSTNLPPLTIDLPTTTTSSPSLSIDQCESENTGTRAKSTATRIAVTKTLEKETEMETSAITTTAANLALAHDNKELNIVLAGTDGDDVDVDEEVTINKKKMSSYDILYSEIKNRASKRREVESPPPKAEEAAAVVRTKSTPTIRQKKSRNRAFSSGPDLDEYIINKEKRMKRLWGNPGTTLSRSKSNHPPLSPSKSSPNLNKSGSQTMPTRRKHKRILSENNDNEAGPCTTTPKSSRKITTTTPSYTPQTNPVRRTQMRRMKSLSDMSYQRKDSMDTLEDGSQQTPIRASGSQSSKKSRLEELKFTPTSTKSSKSETLKLTTPKPFSFSGRTSSSTSTSSHKKMTTSTPVDDCGEGKGETNSVRKLNKKFGLVSSRILGTSEKKKKGEESSTSTTTATTTTMDPLSAGDRLPFSTIKKPEKLALSKDDKDKSKLIRKRFNFTSEPRKSKEKETKKLIGESATTLPGPEEDEKMKDNSSSTTSTSRTTTNSNALKPGNTKTDDKGNVKPKSLIRRPSQRRIHLTPEETDQLATKEKSSTVTNATAQKTNRGIQRSATLPAKSRNTREGPSADKSKKDVNTRKPFTLNFSKSSLASKDVRTIDRVKAGPLPPSSTSRLTTRTKVSNTLRTSKSSHTLVTNTQGSTAPNAGGPLRTSKSSHSLASNNNKESSTAPPSASASTGAPSNPSRTTMRTSKSSHSLATNDNVMPSSSSGSTTNPATKRSSRPAFTTSLVSTAAHNNPGRSLRGSKSSYSLAHNTTASSTVTSGRLNKGSSATTAARGSTLSTTSSSSTRGPLIRSNTLKRDTDREERVLTKSKSQSNISRQPTAKPRPKFDLKASLNRKLGYTPHTGKLKDFKGSCL